MADRVYTQENITLEDYDNGDEYDIVLRPLPLARLRRFMASWLKIDDIDFEEEGMNGIKLREAEYAVTIECSGIALEPQLKDKVVDDSGNKGKTFNQRGNITPEYKDLLERLLDEQTIRRILEVCGGIRLPDPKALEEALKDQESPVVAE